MIDHNRNLEPTPRGVPTLGQPSTEVTEEGCEQHGPREKALADAVRRAMAECPPGDDEAAGVAVDDILAAYNGAVAAQHGEPVPDASQMTFAGYKAVVKVRFTDGKGAKLWGFDVSGRKDSYLGVMLRGSRPAPEEVPGVCRRTLMKVRSLLF